MAICPHIHLSISLSNWISQVLAEHRAALPNSFPAFQQTLFQHGVTKKNCLKKKTALAMGLSSDKGKWRVQLLGCHVRCHALYLLVSSLCWLKEGLMVGTGSTNWSWDGSQDVLMTEQGRIHDSPHHIVDHIAQTTQKHISILSYHYFGFCYNYGTWILTNTELTGEWL